MRSSAAVSVTAAGTCACAGVTKREPRPAQCVLEPQAICLLATPALRSEVRRLFETTVCQGEFTRSVQLDGTRTAPTGLRHVKERT